MWQASVEEFLALRPKAKRFVKPDRLNLSTKPGLRDVRPRREVFECGPHKRGPKALTAMGFQHRKATNLADMSLLKDARGPNGCAVIGRQKMRRTFVHPVNVFFQSDALLVDEDGLAHRQTSSNIAGYRDLDHLRQEAK